MRGILNSSIFKGTFKTAQCEHSWDKRKKNVSYPVKKVDSSNSSDFPHIVNESHISLGGGIKLSNLNVPKAIEKLSPHLRSDAVSDGQTHFMLFVVVSLKSNKTKKDLIYRQSFLRLVLMQISCPLLLLKSSLECIYLCIYTKTDFYSAITLHWKWWLECALIRPVNVAQRYYLLGICTNLQIKSFQSSFFSSYLNVPLKRPKH